MAAQRKEKEEKENEELLSEEESYEEVVKKAASAFPVKINSKPPQQDVGHIPEVVDDFLRNFLRRAGLTQTLMVFETEWTEKLQRVPQMTATAKTGMSFIPDALTHRQLLQSELDVVCRETDVFRREVLEAEERTVRMQRETDFYRLQYRRAAEDKKTLTENIKQLRKHLESYEPALRQLDDKCQTARRQIMLIGLEKDRVRNTTESRVMQENLQITNERGIGGSNSANKPSAKSRIKRHTHDSESPFCSRRINAPVTSQTWKNPSSFTLSCSIRAHKLPISCISLHPQKLVLASASDDHSWRLWLLPANGETVGQMAMTGEGHSDWLSCCSFHPDGTKLATTSGDSTLRLWDASLGCCVLTLSGHSQPTWGCSFHSCGQFLASCSADGTTKLWDLNSQRCCLTLRGHTGSVNSVSFQPCSNLVLTCSTDRTLALWDARLGIRTATFHGHQRSCSHAAFSLASDLMASCDIQGAINLWDTRKPPLAVVTVDVGPSAANQVVFSPSGKMLAVASKDSLVRLVETDSCAVTSLLGHSESVESVTFDHTEQTVMSAGSDGLVNLWL